MLRVSVQVIYCGTSQRKPARVGEMQERDGQKTEQGRVQVKGRADPEPSRGFGV